MKSQSRSQLMWSVTVAALLWFAAPAGAIPLKSWDDKIPDAGKRFKVLSKFAGAAVLDKETQLVWEQSPDTGTLAWSGARFICINKNVGGRKGWRSPSVAELVSLVDSSTTSQGPTLPPGHPFLNVQSANYWSATTNAETPTFAWGVDFFGGEVNGFNKANTFHAWCVRGGMNADQY